MIGQRKKIGIDLDDTSVLTHPFYAETLVANFGNPGPFTPREIAAYYQGRLEEYWEPRVCAEDLMRVKAQLRALANENIWQPQIPAMESAAESLWIFQEKFDTPFITARGEEIRQGTLESIHVSEFPKDDLVMRSPEYTFEQGSIWKAEYLIEHQDELGIVALVDDSRSLPSVLFPKFHGYLFFFGVEEEGFSSPHPRVIPCRDWRSVIRNVQKHLGL